MSSTEILFSYENTSFGPEIEYTFRLLCSLAGAPPPVVVPAKEHPRPTLTASAVAVHYGNLHPAAGALPSIRIAASTFFGPDYQRQSSLPKEPVQRLGGLPVLYWGGDQRTEAICRNAEGGLLTTCDLIASAFYMASRYEETVIPERDGIGRFPSRCSLARRAGFLHEPVVHRYAEVLRSMLLKSGIELPQRARRFTVCMTHDVDAIRPMRPGEILAHQMRPRPSRGTTDASAAPARNASHRSAVDALLRGTDYLRYLACGRNHYWTFDRLLDANRQHGASSTFFLMARKEDPLQPRYSLDERDAIHLMSIVREAGSEIALHGSYLSADRPEFLGEERARLQHAAGTRIDGNRLHALRFDAATTLKRLEIEGFRYDSTCGYPDAIGFRAGIAVPFRPFDLGLRRELRLTEIPLVIVDNYFFSFHRVSRDQTMLDCKRIIENVKDVDGCVALLWHPHYLYTHRYGEEYAQLYPELLKEICRAGGTASSCGRALDARGDARP